VVPIVKRGTLPAVRADAVRNRQKLLAVAEELFTTKGFTTTNEYSPGTLQASGHSRLAAINLVPRRGSRDSSKVASKGRRLATNL